MKWKKLGQIFDPTKHELITKLNIYAQSPQLLEFDDYVRIYFSTRVSDKENKFLSHVGFVEIDKNLKKIISTNKKEIISLGNLGCYDEHGIFPFHILKDNDKLFGYISGWSRRISVDIETSIGLSESFDNGITFKRNGEGPILSSTLNEPFLVGDPFVMKLDGVLNMWYIYGTEWITNPHNNVKERVYKIGHAISQDNLNWIKTDRQLIEDRLNQYECQALPTVIKIGNKFHMIFCFREAIGFRDDMEKGYRLGYAHSVDGINWIRDDENSGINLSDSGWDSEMMCYPHLNRINNDVYLFYNGNQFGKYGFGCAILESD